MAKIKCLNPLHQDSNPSMEVYDDGAWCFVCGFSTNKVSDPSAVQKPKENLAKRLEYIDGLTVRPVRGLLLPADGEGYFVVWPDRSFYFQRLYSGKPRYRYPRGYKVPLYTRPGNKTLIVVEGVINALSLCLVDSKYTIVSPGSATELTRHISVYLNYELVYIVIDKDVAGVINGLKLKEELHSRKKRVQIIAKEKDYNQILQEKGEAGLKEEFYRDLGMP